MYWGKYCIKHNQLIYSVMNPHLTISNLKQHQQLRNYTLNTIQKQAMDDLRQISERTWAAAPCINKTIRSQKSTRRNNNNNQPQVEFARHRPSSQTMKRNLIFPIEALDQTPIRMLKVWNIGTMFNRHSCGQQRKVDKMKETVKLSNYNRTESFRQQKHPKQCNYSALRVLLEKDFFIGNTDLSQKPKIQAAEKGMQKSRIKSLRRGRLWLGRPVLQFQ